MFLICGLGNPGKKYSKTRHNIGFILIDKLVEDYNFKKIKIDKQKELYKGKIDNNECMLIKPLKYMNVSGLILQESLNFFKINLSKLYVVHDDLDLKTAKIKIKIGGSNGGHNGLLSIDEKIGKNYYRIRFGISHPGSKELVSKYVLSKFSKNERNEIDKKLINISKYFGLIFKDKNLFLTQISTMQ